jgi:hypothetical protein
MAQPNSSPSPPPYAPGDGGGGSSLLPRIPLLILLRRPLEVQKDVRVSFLARAIAFATLFSGRKAIYLSTYFVKLIN